MDPEELLGNVVALAIIGGFFVVIYGILIFICVKLMQAMQVIPPEHQKIPPGLVWLIIIPCIGVFANFFVFTQIPKSYESYFASRGLPYDQNLFTFGLVYSCLGLVTLIPYIGSCFGIVALVMLVLFLVKLSELKKAAQSVG